MHTTRQHHLGQVNLIGIAVKDFGFMPIITQVRLWTAAPPKPATSYRPRPQGNPEVSDAAMADVGCRSRAIFEQLLVDSCHILPTAPARRRDFEPHIVR
jgi:hypothetical protein